MKCVPALLLVICFWTPLTAQVNLVQNPGFEIYDSCAGDGGIYHVSPWFQPTWGTSDYFHSCSTNPYVSTPSNLFGFQFPHNGNAYVGGMTCYTYYDTTSANYREYIEVMLTDSLLAGTRYFVSYYVSLGDSSNIATDRIDAYFSSDSITANHWFCMSYPAQIQNAPGNFISDKISWTKISGSFIAAGGEQYMTLGNFRTYQTTDTIPVSGGSYIGEGGYYYIDDVCVTSDSLFNEVWTGATETPLDPEYWISPCPATDYCTLSKLSEGKSRFVIFNGLGQLVEEGELITSVNIQTESWPNGIYFIRIEEGGSVISRKLVVQH